MKLKFHYSFRKRPPQAPTLSTAVYGSQKATLGSTFKYVQEATTYSFRWVLIYPFLYFVTFVIQAS